MAQQQLVTYTDDMDPSSDPAALDEATDALGFRFAIDGAVYQLDTTAVQAARVREFLAPYIARSKKVAKFRADGPYLVTPPSAHDRPREGDDTQIIRAWAKENGLNINDRGRLPVKILEAYANRTLKTNTPAAPKSRPAAKPPRTPLSDDLVNELRTKAGIEPGAQATSAASKTPAKKTPAKATTAKTKSTGGKGSTRRPTQPTFKDTATA